MSRVCFLLILPGSQLTLGNSRRPNCTANTSSLLLEVEVRNPSCLEPVPFFSKSAPFFH